MSTLPLNREILFWGMERSGLNEEALEEKFPKIRKWISGATEPTFKQLEDLAKAVFIPFGYFFLSKPPAEKLPIPFYRTVKSGENNQISPNLLETIYAMQRRQIWLQEYKIENEYEPLEYVASAGEKESPVKVAEEIRKVLGLEENWTCSLPNKDEALRHFRYVIENAGITVMANGIVENNTHRRLSVKEFRGFVLVDKYAPLIFVNNSDSKAAQMFTLAHELAHVWFGSSGVFDLRQLQPSEDVKEIVCNQVAAELLISTRLVRHTWEKTENKNEIYRDMAKKFKVSEIVVARRLQDCGFITKEEFLTFYDEYIEKLKNITKVKQGGGDFLNNQNLRVNKQFMSLVLQALGEGKIQYTEAYRLTGLHRKSFEDFAFRVTGKP